MFRRFSDLLSHLREDEEVYEEELSRAEGIPEFLGVPVESVHVATSEDADIPDEDDTHDRTVELLKDVPSQVLPLETFTYGGASYLEFQGHKVVLTNEWGMGTIWTTQAGAEALQVELDKRGHKESKVALVDEDDG